MLRWPTMVGLGLGLLVAAIVLALAGGHQKRSISSGHIISECDGRLREVVIHYEPSARNIVEPVYRDLLAAFEPDVVVHVLCPSEAAFRELLSFAPARKCLLKPVIVSHPMTTWSRDRWVALMPAAPGGPTTILSPRHEAAGEIWPARAGDERVSEDLARALHPRLLPKRSELFFDGGDFLADSENVFVVPRVLQRNVQHTVRDPREFLQALAPDLKKRLILLRQAPDHHAGMFMASVGGGAVLVGDPKLALACLTNAVEKAATFAKLPEGPDLRPETQALFDAVAVQCAEEGYKVSRIPVLPAPDGKTYLTFVNALVEHQGPRRVVYLPYYDGTDSLNAAARQVWEQLGYQVRPVNCTTVYRHFGCLHCLVNVLSRS